MRNAQLTSAQDSSPFKEKLGTGESLLEKAYKKNSQH